MGTVTREELKGRTREFALRVMKLVEALPANTSGRSIGSQLVRCGTSVGANYRAACCGRSKADFVSKLGIVLEEADEYGFWLELIIAGNLLKGSLVEPLLKESEELAAIFASSVKSARNNMKDLGPKI